MRTRPRSSTVPVTGSAIKKKHRVEDALQATRAALEERRVDRQSILMTEAIVAESSDANGAGALLNGMSG